MLRERLLAGRQFSVLSSQFSVLSSQFSVIGLAALPGRLFFLAEGWMETSAGICIDTNLSG
jgi:hypothetical protein